MSFISVFDVMGPNMIGPSSSHTAGAARIGYLAQKMINGPLAKVDFILRQNIQGTRYRPCPPWRVHGLFHRCHPYTEFF